MERAVEQSAPLPVTILAHLLFRQAVVLAIKGRGRSLSLWVCLNFSFYFLNAAGFDRFAHAYVFICLAAVHIGPSRAGVRTCTFLNCEEVGKNEEDVVWEKNKQ